jgi:hypothetical protein
VLLLHHQHLLDGSRVATEAAYGFGGEGVPQHDVPVHAAAGDELVPGAEVEAVRQERPRARVRAKAKVRVNLGLRRERDKQQQVSMPVLVKHGTPRALFESTRTSGKTALESLRSSTFLNS